MDTDGHGSAGGFLAAGICAICGNQEPGGEGKKFNFFREVELLLSNPGARRWQQAPLPGSDRFAGGESASHLDDIPPRGDVCRPRERCNSTPVNEFTGCNIPNLLKEVILPPKPARQPALAGLGLFQAPVSTGAGRTPPLTRR